MKTCSHCQKTKPVSEFGKSAQAKDGKRGWCFGCWNEYGNKWRRENPKRTKELRDASSKRRKEEVYAAYGNRCVCCGETEKAFLVIDHINNDGAAHRRKMSQNWKTGPTNAISSGGVYSWLRKNGFPDGFQLLCSNCNLAKTRVGKCPHLGILECRDNGGC